MRKPRTLLVAALLAILTIALAGCGASDGGDGEAAPLGEKYGTLFSSFSASDLLGEPIDESVVLDSELTLVYLWATDCPPCVESMPKLQAVQESIEPKGVQVLGILLDIQDSSGIRLGTKVADALAITGEAGVTFPNIDVPPAIRDMLYNEIQYTPTAFFVDSTGTIVSELYIGAREVEDWSDIIDSLLEE